MAAIICDQSIQEYFDKALAADTKFAAGLLLGQNVMTNEVDSRRIFLFSHL
jgi:hypothetical protein